MKKRVFMMDYYNKIVGRRIERHIKDFKLYARVRERRVVGKAVGVDKMWKKGGGCLGMRRGRYKMCEDSRCPWQDMVIESVNCGEEGDGGGGG
ncbi:MAG: hypothetical protein N2595_02510 [bacterium]|nr:hypothetical protein [bacterium]